MPFVWIYCESFEIRNSRIFLYFIYSFQWCIKWGSNRWIIRYSIDILSVGNLRCALYDFTAAVRPIIFAYGVQWQWVLFSSSSSVDSHVVHLIACAKLNEWLNILICKCTKATNSRKKNEVHTTKRPKRSVQERPRSKAFSQTIAFKSVVLWTTSTEKNIIWKNKVSCYTNTHLHGNCVYLRSVLESQM